MTDATKDALGLLLFFMFNAVLYSGIFYVIAHFVIKFW